MKIGDKIYNFDPNHREYERDENGRAVGGAVYIKHWKEVEIIGETRVSWLVGYKWHPTKISKKKLANGELSSYLTTWDEVENKAWVNGNRYKISKSVENVKDIATLRAIKDLVEGK